MKKYLTLIILFVLLLIGFSVYWWSSSTKAPSDSESKVRFVIVQGRGASQIANELYKSGLIKSPLAFKFYVQLTGRASKISAGEFEIGQNLSMYEVIQELSGGPLELWVTIPEGLRKEEVVERFITGLEISTDSAEKFRTDFLNNAKEGYMFPETYLFPRDVSGIVVASRMMELFEDKVVNINSEIEKSDLSLQEIVTLASIVERETKTNEERPVVAGILMNRLKIGMALQADATAQYAVANVRCFRKTVKCTNWWIPPTLEDLEINSPYNTYKFPGIPPAPIANPGYSSIAGVVNPTITDYLFYIHDPEGNIHYAKTLAEHNQNISKYLR